MTLKWRWLSHYVDSMFMWGHSDFWCKYSRRSYFHVGGTTRLLFSPFHKLEEDSEQHYGRKGLIGRQTTPYSFPAILQLCSTTCAFSRQTYTMDYKKKRKEKHWCILSLGARSSKNSRTKNFLQQCNLPVFMLHEHLKVTNPNTTPGWSLHMHTHARTHAQKQTVAVETNFALLWTCLWCNIIRVHWFYTISTIFSGSGFLSACSEDQRNSRSHITW